MSCEGYRDGGLSNEADGKYAVQAAAMDQYRGVVKQHTSFTLDLLRHTNDGNTYRYSSNFRQGTSLPYA